MLSGGGKLFEYFQGYRLSVQLSQIHIGETTASYFFFKDDVLVATELVVGVVEVNVVVGGYYGRRSMFVKIFIKYHVAIDGDTHRLSFISQPGKRRNSFQGFHFLLALGVKFLWWFCGCVAD